MSEDRPTICRYCRSRIGKMFPDPVTGRDDWCSEPYAGGSIYVNVCEFNTDGTKQHEPVGAS